MYKLYIIQKKIRTFAKDYGCNWNFFPSGSVGVMHKPSGSAVPDRNVSCHPITPFQLNI